MTTGRRCKRQPAHWLDQVSLKDRATFLEDQKMLHEAWKPDMAALIEGQNAALQQVVMLTVALLRAQGQPWGRRRQGRLLVNRPQHGRAGQRMCLDLGAGCCWGPARSWS